MSDKSDPSNDAASSGRGDPHWPLPLLLATAVPVLLFFFLPPLSKSGLWDPYELNVADLSRRIALNLFHARSLAIDGSDNSLPHLNDLGRPQLPFSSIALGFKLFGLHEWAGRLPLALWGLIGVLATYAFTTRLFDRRAALYSAVVLSTMPLYFVQARSMMGEVCEMAGLAMAFGGLAVLVFDPALAGTTSGTSPSNHSTKKGPSVWLRRAPWLLLTVAGLLVGFESRGGLLGLGIPLVGVGLAWAGAYVASAHRRKDRFANVVGGVSVVAGTAVVTMAVRAASQSGHDLDLWLGALIHVPAKYPTFDYFVAIMGHALAPWSALLPFALGRLVILPPARDGSGAVRDRESEGRLVLLVGLAVAFVAHGYLADRTELAVFTAPALCAVACAVAIRDLERGAGASVALAVGTLILAGVLHHDFHELPEKAYLAFGVSSAPFPEGFKEEALKRWWVVLGGFGFAAFLALVENGAKRTPFDPASYAKVLRALRESYGGALAFVYLAAIAGSSLAGLVFVVAARMRAHWVAQMSSTVRDVALNGWWLLALIPLAGVFGLTFVCDLWLWAFRGDNRLSLRSLTRGFEPFEELFGRLRLRPWTRSSSKEPSGGQAASVQPSGSEAEVVRVPPSGSDGEAVRVPPSGSDGVSVEEGWVALLVVTPLLLLGIPALTWALVYSVVGRPLIAAAAGIPSGLVVFLAMGLLGDLLRRRSTGLVLGGFGVGCVLCLSYYPALANQLSPKDVFETYRRVCPDASLALLGVGGRASAYYAGGQPQIFGDPTSAYQWLAAGGGSQRRCLALKAEELPKLNQLWRQRPGEPPANLPIVDARSSQIMLAASTLGPRDKNENPLAEIVLSSSPQPQRKIDANLEDKLIVLGIDLEDDRGRLVDSVNASQSYHLRTYYRVLAPITTEWEAFVHIDGYHRRHNGDHKPMSGKYPMSFWLPGDVVVDDHEFKLEPNFTPGTYGIYFGLFVGDTRMKVQSGPNDGDNRINGGALRVQ